VSPPVTGDEALIRGVAHGDREALQTLFARHRVKVFRFIHRIVRNRTAAEDLTADVFLDVWRKAGRFGERCAALTWILAIARYKALSTLRRQRECPLEETAAARLADHADDPEAALASKGRRELLRALLQRLSSDHREVIDLVYYHEKSIEEVAKIVDIPVNTVKTRMFYARKQLARHLQDAGLAPELL
jgi:RNA polymerase sigma-70 factor (ECF subfamily)